MSTTKLDNDDVRKDAVRMVAIVNLLTAQLAERLTAIAHHDDELEDGAELASN